MSYACAECGHLHYEGATVGYSECPIDGCGCEGQEWARELEHRATDFTAVERYGYTVEATDNNKIPYEIVGKRGARYGLMRNMVNPHRLFTVNAKDFTRSALVAGTYTWFSDEGEKLRPMR